MSNPDDYQELAPHLDVANVPGNDQSAVRPGVDLDHFHRRNFK